MKDLLRKIKRRVAGRGPAKHCILLPRQPTPEPNLNARRRTFVLRVPDFNRSTAYFRDVLGFRILLEGATDWRVAQRDGVRIMLGRGPNDLSPSEIGVYKWFGYLPVSDVDALHAELTDRGAKCSLPTDTAYGTREIVVTTIDGHRIVFGQDTSVFRGSSAHF